MGKQRSFPPTAAFVAPAVAAPATVEWQVGTGFVIEDGEVAGIVAGEYVAGSVFAPLVLVGGAALVAGFAVWYLWGRYGWERVLAPPFDPLGVGYQDLGGCSPPHRSTFVKNGWTGQGTNTGCLLQQGGSLSDKPAPQALNQITVYAQQWVFVSNAWDTLHKYKRVGTAPAQITSFARPVVTEEPFAEPKVQEKLEPRVEPAPRLRLYEEPQVEWRSDDGAKAPPRTPPHVRRPPPRGTRERKYRVTGRAAQELFGFLTEVEDAVNCLVRNVHPKRSVMIGGRWYHTTKAKNPGKMGYFEKVEWGAENLASLDVGGFVACLAQNEIEDRVIGKLGRLADNAWREAHGHLGISPTPQGVQSGPWDRGGPSIPSFMR